MALPYMRPFAAVEYGSTLGFCILITEGEVSSTSSTQINTFGISMQINAEQTTSMQSDAEQTIPF